MTVIIRVCFLMNQFLPKSAFATYGEELPQTDRVAA